MAGCREYADSIPSYRLPARDTWANVWYLAVAGAYLSPAEQLRCIKLVIMQITASTSSNIKGDVLIDLSAGSFVHHLYAPSEFFKHIIVLKVNDRCIMELKRWLDTRTGEFEWGHATKIHVEIEGKSAELQDKEGKVREAAQHVVKCDLNKQNIMDPIVLPPADCIISVCFLEVICKDQDDYIRYIRTFSELLKPGGHLLLFGATDMTYFTVGNDRIHTFPYTEDFVRKVLVGEGFVIDKCVTKEATGISDLIDHKGVLFIAAHKEK
ncbi:indolethylamine N-methyltransferase-like [Dendropsophus ebraccatus]|uniref:indolethylamine N-methyltransferase-like n=1 Tax=Dendropsophus ebraccatus TaxID=150705 RepID=UPI0038319052